MENYKIKKGTCHNWRHNNKGITTVGLQVKLLLKKKRDQEIRRLRVIDKDGWEYLKEILRKNETIPYLR